MQAGISRRLGTSERPEKLARQGHGDLLTGRHDVVASKLRDQDRFRSASFTLSAALSLAALPEHPSSIGSDLASSTYKCILWIYSAVALGNPAYGLNLASAPSRSALSSGAHWESLNPVGAIDGVMRCQLNLRH
jgi:hypothetical protein